MPFMTKHNSERNLFIGPADKVAVCAILRSLVPDPKAADLGVPLSTLYQQLNETRAPSLVVCHNAQAEAGQWPIYELLAGVGGFRLAPLPRRGPPAEPALAMIEATAEVGDVARKLTEVLDPTSPGGVACTPAEFAGLLVEIEQAVGVLHQVAQGLRPRR